MPIDPITGAVLGISAATGIGNSITAGIGNKKRIQAAKEAATIANQRNIENWERANRYNDPSAAMARLKAAGLNPNMVYGTGSATGGTAGAVAGASAPVPNIQDIPIDMPNALSVLGQHQALEKAKAQTALTWGQLGVQALQVDSTKLTIEGKKLQNEILARTGMEMAEAQLESTKAGTERTKAGTGLIEQQRLNAKKAVEQMDQAIAASKQNVKSQAAQERLNKVKAEIQEKYLTRWKETGVDPNSSQFLRVISEVFSRATSANTVGTDNPPITMKQVNEMFPNQVKDLSKQQLNTLWKLINAQYGN